MRRERGLVLLSVVLILTLLALATGASLWLTRSELWAAGHARAETQAAYSAEAGVRHALAALAPDVDWSALVNGAPAALADPAQPGPWPIGGPGRVSFPGPPFVYAVERIDEGEAEDVAAAPETVLLRSSATAVRGAKREMVAIAGRASRPYLPAALVLDRGALELEAAALGGPHDPRVVLDARAAGPAASALASASAESLAAALEEASRAGVTLHGGTSSSARSFDVARFAERSGLATAPPDVLAAPLGSTEAPAALLVRSGTAPALEGAGVLLSAGDLEIAGPVAFDGAVVVAGRLRLGDASCRVRGIVWARSVAFRGPCRIELDVASVEAADAVLRLPRLPVLLALQ